MSGGSRRGEKAELLAALRQRFGFTENAAISLGRLHNASIRRLERELGELVARERGLALAGVQEPMERAAGAGIGSGELLARERRSAAREPACCADCGDSFVPDAVERAARCPNCGSARRPREVAA